MSEHPTTKTVVVNNASIEGRIQVTRLEVRSGECLVLCGPNGAGKSTLLRLLAGLEPSARGEVLLDGAPLSKKSRREIASWFAWLPQRPHLAEVVTCEAVVAAARYRFLEGPMEALKGARAVLEQQGLSHLAERATHQISGGELQRVLISALIAQDAPFLLIDEPANHLDPRHQVEAYRALGKLWRSEGRGVLLVTHDVRLVPLLGPSDQIRVIGIKAGQLLPESRLDDPKLRKLLGDLYGVPFVEPQEPGGLSVDLKSIAHSESPPR